MKTIIKHMAVLAITIIVSATAIAQPPGDPDTDPDASVPIDEGLFTVLLSGAAIGISKLIKQKRSNHVKDSD